MQLQKQLIHTPPHFFNRQDAVGQLDTDGASRCLAERRRCSTGNILVERRDFHVRVADTHGTQNQVGALIRRMYSWRGYRLDTSAPRHSPSRTTLQACANKDTLGTLTLNVDSENGLLADGLYRREIDSLRMRGAAVCELTGLAVSASFSSNELLASLFHLLHIIGHRLHRVTDAVIEINPRHSAYYQRLLGFRKIGERKVCGRVNAPAVLLHVETDFIEEQIARYAGLPKKAGHSLYPYFFSRLEAEHLGQRILEMGHLLPASPQTDR